MIQIKNLVKSHGSNRILDGISLSVEAGEVAVFIGPSGGGKSTLLRCVNGLEPFQEGSITVEDKTITPTTHADSPELLAIRRRLGMVFQQFHLFPHMSAIQNVMIGPLRVLGEGKEESEAKALRLLDQVGLKAKRDARTGELSGGQQQRVAIARALAVDPVAMLFDEPTSALDPKMADEVLTVMTDLAKTGMTMMIVTHAMSFARRVANRVHFMHGGRIAESGEPKEFFSNPQTAEAREFLQKVEL